MILHVVREIDVELRQLALLLAKLRLLHGKLRGSLLNGSQVVEAVHVHVHIVQ